MNTASLVPAVLLCTLSIALMVSSRGARLSVVSPLAIVPAIYLMSLGLPALAFSLGLDGREIFLRPEYVEVVSYYTLGLLCTFYAGHLFAGFRASRRTHAAWQKVPDRSTIGQSLQPQQAILGEISVAFLLAIGTVALATHAYLAGKERFWEGFVPRGAGQWNPMGWDYYVACFGLFLLLLSTVTAGLAHGSRARARLWLVPLLFALFLAARGSRGTLLPFFLFVLASETLRKRNSLKKPVAVGVLCLCSVVMISGARSPYLGLTDFFRGLGDTQHDISSMDALSGFSSLGVTTTVFWISDDITVHGRLGHAWAELTPLPSFIVHQDRRFTDVLPYLGIRDANNAFPFPVVGELYFFFGWLGIFLGFPAGFVVAWIYSQCRRSVPEDYPYGVLWPIIYMVCAFGIIMSVHSGLRTVTRLPLWGFVWYLAFTGTVRFLAAPLHTERWVVVVKSTQATVIAAPAQH
jgi:hypothetical protein